MESHRKRNIWEPQVLIAKSLLGSLDSVCRNSKANTEEEYVSPQGASCFLSLPDLTAKAVFLLETDLLLCIALPLPQLRYYVHKGLPFKQHFSPFILYLCWLPHKIKLRKVKRPAASHSTPSVSSIISDLAPFLLTNCEQPWIGSIFHSISRIDYIPPLGPDSTRSLSAITPIKVLVGKKKKCLEIISKAGPGVFVTQCHQNLKPARQARMLFIWGGGRREREKTEEAGEHTTFHHS